MSTRTVERVDGWESVPFGGGFAGLHDLAGKEFSGAVIAGPTRLFMLNGTVVGVLEGTIEDFEDASGTAKRSPHEALPLLAVMQERADEVKAQYYTKDTALAEVDRTLSSGNFTGFIELSENILSGDYYTVYHQGRSMSVAWVGNSDNLLTDDDAFATANDEVGIYEVMPADIEPTEIPGLPEDDAEEQSTDSAAAGDEPAGAGPADDTQTSEAKSDKVTQSHEAIDDLTETPPDAAADSSHTDTERTQTTSEPTPDRGPTNSGPQGSKAAGAAPNQSSRRSESDEPPSADSRSEAALSDRTAIDADSETQPESGQDVTDRKATERDATETREAQQTTAGNSPAQGDQAAPTNRRSEPTDPKPSQRTETRSESAAAPTPESGSNGSGADLETRSVPSLDPDKSEAVKGATATSVSPTQTPPTPRRDQSDQDDPTPASEPQELTPDEDGRHGTAQRSQPSETADQRQSPPDEEPSPYDRERVAELESELEQRAETVSELESDLVDLRAMNQQLRNERDRLESELADTRAEIDRLKEQRNEQDDTATGGTRLNTSEAVNGTNLFVRYDSKGKATLAEAKDGDASREEVEANLRLEYHTQFEAEGVTVDGTPFVEFLKDSIQYRFVDWLIQNLLYEIRDTEHVGAMRDLHEGLPAIDRAELNGNVAVTYTEDGQENRSQERFDVVVRDRMGNPLVVANINDSREPASESQMSDLIRNAERVGNASDSLASAFLVTNSFFEPGALETAEKATSSGLFNRDKRKSFVNLTRKDGFHLCLLEARNREFHLAVPEL